MFNSLCIKVIGDAIAFSLGLATTLALLGIVASFAGKAYGQVGQGLPLVASSLAIVMGLNLLEVLTLHTLAFSSIFGIAIPDIIFSVFFQIIELQLPSFFNDFDPRAAAANFPSSNPPIYVFYDKSFAFFFGSNIFIGLQDL